MDAHAGDPARRSLRRRAAIALVALAAVAGLAFAGLALLERTRGTSTDALYEPPDPLPDGPPGTVVRAGTVARPPAGTKAYRLLYLSRGHGGGRVALSALLFVPRRPAPANGRNVVAFAHGTVGIARGCAVSDGRGFVEHVDGLARFIRAGHAVVVPDFEGLGTRGPHPYLVGEATAHAILDAVRATRRFGPAGASERFAVWGVGQGGHGALFTGQRASSYAPELDLAGVAAGAPMANLGRLIETSAGSPAGDVVAAYMLASWSRVYPQLAVEDILTAPARATVEQISALCLPVDHGRIGAALGDQRTGLTYRTRRPWNRAPWSELLARNAPGGSPIAAPVIITQGRADGFVRPAATARFVRYLCGQGVRVQYRPSRGVAHGDLGEKTAPFVSKWIAGRLRGDRARSSCR